MARELLYTLLLLPFVTSSVLQFLQETQDDKRDFYERAAGDRTGNVKQVAQEHSSGERTGNANHVVAEPPSGVCGGLACPPSQLVHDAGTYQLRYFPPAPYAKTAVQGLAFQQAEQVLYKRLYDYFNGDNTKNITMPLTNPLILRLDPGSDGLWSNDNQTLFFFISPEVVSPPDPTDTTIRVLEVNEYYMYIRTFPGKPVTYPEWMEELLQLAADLDADGVAYVKSYFYFATYTNPWHQWDRVNEVQLLRPKSNTLDLEETTL